MTLAWLMLLLLLQGVLPEKYDVQFPTGLKLNQKITMVWNIKSMDQTLQHNFFSTATPSSNVVLYINARYPISDRYVTRLSTNGTSQVAFNFDLPWPLSDGNNTIDKYEYIFKKNWITISFNDVFFFDFNYVHGDYRDVRLLRISSLDGASILKEFTLSPSLHDHLYGRTATGQTFSSVALQTFSSLGSLIECVAVCARPTWPLPCGAVNYNTLTSDCHLFNDGYGPLVAAGADWVVYRETGTDDYLPYLIPV